MNSLDAENKEVIGVYLVTYKRLLISILDVTV